MLMILVSVDHNEETGKFVVSTAASSTSEGACQHEITFFEELKKHLHLVADKVGKLDEESVNFIAKLKVDAGIASKRDN